MFPDFFALYLCDGDYLRFGLLSGLWAWEAELHPLKCADFTKPLLIARRFTERGRLYARYFEIAEKALEAGNDEVLKDVLQSALAVYGSEITDGTDNIRNLLDFRHEKNAA